MNKGIVKSIGVMAVMAALTGCGSMAAYAPASAATGSILSGAEAQSMIQVSVTITEPSQQESSPDTPTVAALSN